MMGAMLALTEAGAGSSRGGEVLEALSQLAGRLHPLTVHFPVGLLLVAALAEVWGAIRKRPAASPLARGCLWYGALTACAAAGMGWLNAEHEFAGDTTLTLGLHRWLGVATAAVAMFAAFMALAAGNASMPRAVGAYRAGLMLSALLVAVGGHFGGVLTHGEDYVTEPMARVVAAVRGTGGGGKGGIALTRKDGSEGDTPQPHPQGGALKAVDFATEVWPILDVHCVDCHGDVKKKGKLRLDSRAGALAGGKGGAAVIPGDSEKSPLIRRVLGLDRQQRMPVDADPLTEEQIATLRAWVDGGAEWPEAGGAKGMGAGGVSDEEESHWAYAKPVRPEVPKTTQKWGNGPIDAFVLAKLEREKMKPSAEAERGVLLRRVSLDLIGLPPTVEELEAFERDETPGAYERAVDRLLGSPRYGEKWARMWLDLARYADSRGYEKDNPWSMWAYRDWVIQALNEDMAFDRFTIEQIAGDLLPDARESQRIATGFNRCSMINEEGGVDPEEARYTTVVDRVGTTATVWLGTTLACAQCHDHKFDPFTMKDFYAFSAFFNSTPIETRDNGSGETEVTSPMMKVRHPMEAAWTEEIAAIEREVGPEKAEEQERAAEAEEVKQKRARARALRGRLAAWGTTQVMVEMEKPRETRIARRGNFMDLGEKVEAGTPEVLPAMGDDLPRNRLGLAKWIVDEDNPLTARVMVNRVWAQYFGRGIVETEEDFGTRGSTATHPELLDYLATEFVANGWSLKKLHREIVRSATYRQASSVTKEMLERDPHNTWLSRGARFRLDAEGIRDQALAIGGLLSAKMGGPSVFPRQPAGIWGHAYSGEEWKESEGEDRYRRGVYTFWKRATPYPTFVAFDAPQRQVTCTRRPRTNTALQALTTLNDPVFLEAAAGLARRVMGVEGDVERRAAWAFRVCVSRSPSEEELGRVVGLYRRAMERFGREVGAAQELLSSCVDAREEGGNEAEWAAWTVVGNVLLNLDEVLTKG